MKNRTYILLIFFLFSFTAGFGQICPSDSVLTDPDVTGGWDWRINPLIIYEHVQATGINQTAPFPNPFHNSLNLNTGFLAEEGPAPNYVNLRDYQPSDGWELIYKHIDDRETPGIGVTHPVMILYNKFRGVLRVFINISDKDADYNSAVITLEILNDQAQTSSSLVGNANLSLADPIAQPLDAFTHDQSMVKINRWEEQDDYWLFAEFPIGYDPCVCLYESRFFVSATLMKGGDLEWVSGGKAPETKKIVANGNDDNNLKETYEVISKFSKGVSTGANTGETSANKAVKTITSVLKFVGPAADTTSNSDENDRAEEVKEAAKKASFKAPEWLKAIPKIGKVIGVVDFLLTGTEDKKTTTTGSQMIETSGSITFETPFKSVSPVAPGALKGNASQYVVPEYNNPLGVFNLLATPQLEYVEYHPGIEKVKYQDSGQNLLKTIEFPTIREYAVSEDLKYVLNPHAEVEIVHMDVSLVYTPKVEKVSIPCDNDIMEATPLNSYIYGPVEYGAINENLSYENRLFLQDINLNYGPDALDESIEEAIYSTPLQSKDCFRYTRFKVFHWDHLGETEIKCKIQLTLKEKNSDKTFMMIHTYPVKTKVSEFNRIREIVDIRDENFNIISSNTYFRDRKYSFENLTRYQDTDYALLLGGAGTLCQTNFFIKELDTSPFFQPNYQIPSNLVVENQHFTTSQTLKAWNSILIGENVTTAPGVNIIANAGNSVEFLEGADIGFNFETVLSSPGTCPVVNEVSADDLNDFCESEKYKDQTTRRSPVVEEPLNHTRVSLQTYPVPFKDNVTIEFELQETSVLSIIITNALGQEVDRLVENTNMETGVHKIDYNASMLVSGIYFITLQGDDLNKTVKIIKN